MLSRTMPPAGTPAGTKHALSYHAACGHARGHKACSQVPCRLWARLQARLWAQLSMLSRTMPPVGLVGVAFFRPHHACSLAPCTSESDSTHVFHVQLHVRLHPIAASRRTPDLFRTVLASLRLRCKKQGLALLRKVRCEQMPSLSLAQRLARAHLSGLMAISCGR